MKERLEQLLAAKGYTSQRFAEIMGVQPSGISHILAGRNKPRFDFLERLLRRFPDVSADWLLLGNGPMFREVMLPGSDAVKDVTDYFDGSKEIGDGNLFPDFAPKHGDYAVGQTVDVSDSIMDPEEFYDEEYGPEYIPDNIAENRGMDRLQETGYVKPVAMDLSADNGHSHGYIEPTQHTEKSNVTNVIERKSRVVPDDMKEPVRTPETVVSEDSPVSGSVIEEAMPDIKEKHEVTNVIAAKSVSPNIVKIVLLYDDGTFKSFDNQ